MFATTAARDQELQDAFVALPTFEDESRQTLNRLSQFAANTDPLVDQLRPAARELSPTLIDLSALAPDLKGLFVELNPLIDASQDGLPGGAARAPRPAARCSGRSTPRRASSCRCSTSSGSTSAS